MGCCSEKSEFSEGDPKKTTSVQSLRSEISDSEYEAPKISKTINIESPKKLTIKDRGRWNSSYRFSSRKKIWKSLSTSASNASSNRSNSFDENLVLPVNFLKKSIREDFITVRKIHKGSNGEVSLATQNKTGIKRVIKEINKSTISMEAQEKTILEIQKYKCLDHPNIIKLHEVYESKKSWYLVYEYLSGGSLLQKINDEGIGYSAACMIIKDILNGLNYSHRKRIYHLGLGLENVLVNSREGKINKILGFAFPWEVEDRVKINEVTCFMAPEVLDGDYSQYVSDIWSTGVILYAIAQGKLPFKGKTLVELQLEYQKGIDFNEDQWVLASSDFKDLLSRMLEYDYKKRISVKDALNHPWIKNRQTVISTPENEKSMENFIKFASKNKLARNFFINLTLMDQKDNFQLIELYKSLDADKDEKISKEELLSEASNISVKIQRKLDKALNSLDFFEKGYIGYSEFLSACTDWGEEENMLKLEGVIKNCQRSENGELSLRKLKANFEQIRNKDWSKLLNVLNAEQSKTISFRDLKQFLFDEKQ